MSEKPVGKWIKNAAGDYHIYHMQDKGIVIGQNVSYQDNIQHTDRAICIKPDGNVVYQYTVDGQPVIIPISESALKVCLSNMLDLIMNLGTVNT